MKNKNLQTALTDLVLAIISITLGSVESVVIDAAGKELIQNWNDHNSDDQIDEMQELELWKDFQKQFSK
jgi:hypothetical protein